MNRYFWLLMRFITDEQTPPERHAVYDRARAAFLEQLLAADPPFPDSHRAYERLAFEEAVRTVEASVARWAKRPTAVAQTLASKPSTDTK